MFESGRRAATERGAVHLGVVREITRSTCSVEIPALARGYSYSGARIVASLAPGRRTGPAVVGDFGAHAHDLPGALAVGDEVVVAFVGASTSALVVLDRLV